MPKVETTTDTAVAEPSTPRPKKKGADKDAVHTSTSRPVVRAEVSVKICRDREFTLQHAKKMIGWTEVKDGPYHLTDFHGNKIRLEASVKNRPFQLSLALSYVSEILNGRWEFNGETIVITETEEVASGQHRLVAFILACQEFERNPEKWTPICSEAGPRMPCLIVYGISNTDRVINTIDTGKPRTLEDTLFRSDLYSTVQENERKKLVKVASYAARTFADRIRAWDDAFAPKRTNLEFLDLLKRHPTLAGDPTGQKQPKSTCSYFVWDENTDKEQPDKVAKAFGLSAGTVAGMMYLMACGETKDAIDGYHRQDHPDESMLDLSLLEKAEEFITEVAGGKIGAVIEGARRNLLDADGQDMGQAGRIAVLVKAWNLFRTGKKLTVDNCTPIVTRDNGAELVYFDGVLAAEVESPDGDMEPQVRVLAEPNVTVGGIDLGGEPLEEDKDAVTDGDPDVIREEPKKGKPTKKPAKGKPAVIGAECLVRDADGDWTGRLLDVYTVTQEMLDAEPDWGADLGEQFATVQQIKGRKSWDVPYADCSLVD